MMNSSSRIQPLPRTRPVSLLTWVLAAAGLRLAIRGYIAMSTLLETPGGQGHPERRRLSPVAALAGLLLIAGSLVMPEYANATSVGDLLREQKARSDANRAAHVRMQNQHQQNEQTLLEQRRAQAVGAPFTGAPRWSMGNEVVSGTASMALWKPGVPPHQWPLVAEEPLGRYIALPTRSIARSGQTIKTQWLLCKYGPVPENPVQMMFWAPGQRINLPPDSIQSFAGYKYADVEMEHCPANYGGALQYYGPSFEAEYQVALAEGAASREQARQYSPEMLVKKTIAAHPAATQAGLRFATMYYGDFDVTNTEAVLALAVPLEVQDMLKTKHNSWYRSVSEVIQKARPPLVENEIRKLQENGQGLLKCDYRDADSLDKVLIFNDRWIGIYFWHKTRPGNVSQAFASWIESANLPLVDVAVEECPRYVGQVFALAQGTTGERAVKLAAQAKLAARKASEPELFACADLLGVRFDSAPPNPARREPNALEMCTATYKHLNQVLANWNNTPGALEAIGGRSAGELGQIIKDVHGGNKSAVLTGFAKKACHPSGRGYSCNYDVGVTSKTETAVLVGGAPGYTMSLGGPAEADFEWNGNEWSIASTQTPYTPPGTYRSPVDPNDWKPLIEYEEQQREERRQKEQTERDRRIQENGWKIKNP